MMSKNRLKHAAMLEHIADELRLDGRISSSARIGEAADVLREADEEIERLTERLAEMSENRFREIAHYVTDGRWIGWWDSQARSTACELGDTLVKAGTWERHPSGVDRRWFYRPIEGKSKQ